MKKQSVGKETGGETGKREEERPSTNRCDKSEWQGTATQELQVWLNIETLNSHSLSLGCRKIVRRRR